jgi:rRNA maturation endonuclease Nob1
LFSSISFASNTNALKNHSRHGEIPKSVLREARDQAESQILNISETKLQSMIKQHELRNVLKKLGITVKEFKSEVKTDVYNYLIDKGYTDLQIQSTLNSRYIKSSWHKI